MKSLKPILLVAAVDQDLGIGKNGTLPWHLKADLAYFKTLTTTTRQERKHNAVIMGRKTWDSLPESFKPLPGRMNIVLTRQARHAFLPGVLAFPSLDAVIPNLARQPKVENIFVIGGAEVFAQVLPHPACEKLYLTHIQSSFNCDTFFPDFKKEFKLASKTELRSENGLEYYFSIYQRP